MLYSKKAKLYMHNEVKQTFKEKEDKRPKLSELTEVMCTSKLIDHLPKISRKMIFLCLTCPDQKTCRNVV